VNETSKRGHFAAEKGVQKGLCVKCSLRQQSQSRPSLQQDDDVYYDKLKIVMVDCRMNLMQAEAQLPNTIGLDIKEECDRE